MIKMFCFLGLMMIMISCSSRKNGKEDKRDIIKTDDTNINIVIKYLKHGGKAVTIVNSDSSQSVGVIMDSNGMVTATTIDKHGRRTHAVEYYNNGRPKGLINFNFPSITGDAVYYFENGNKSKEGRYKDGVPVGIWKQFNEDGRLVAIDTLSDSL